MSDIESSLRRALIASRPFRGPDEVFTAAFERRLKASMRRRAVLLALITLAAAGLVVALVVCVATLGPVLAAISSVAGSPEPLAVANLLVPFLICLFAALFLAPLLYQPK